MLQGRPKGTAAVVIVLVLLASSLFTGAALAQPGDRSPEDTPRAALQAGSVTTDFLCKSSFTGQYRLSLSGTCPAGFVLVVVSQSLPFHYCYSVFTGGLRDTLLNGTCPAGHQLVVIDGSTSFAVCFNQYTGQVKHLATPGSPCPWEVAFLIDFRGEISKYACTEDNLNLSACDFFASGVAQNEIREIGPIPNTSGGFFDCTYQWEFDGDVSPVQSCSNSSDNASIKVALEGLPGIDEVNVTGGPIAGTISFPVRIEFTGTQAATDILSKISIIAASNTIHQDDITIVDGSPSSPGTSYVLPGGVVEIYQAVAGTDPDIPATYGPFVTGGMVDPMTGLFSSGLLLDGDYVVCADGPTAVSPSCELVSVFDADVTLLNLVDVPGTITAAITGTGNNEIQTITQCSFGCNVTGGTFTLTFDGQMTVAIPADATTAQVQAVLEGLSNIDTGDVSVTGQDFLLGFNPGQVMSVEFMGQYANRNVLEMTLTGSLTGSGFGLFYVVNTALEGASATQTLTADRKLSGGTFTLGFGGDTTVPLAWNADAATVEAALNALPSIGGVGGSVVVTGQLVPTTPIEEWLQHQMDIFFSDVPGADTIVLIVDGSNLE